MSSYDKLRPWTEIDKCDCKEITSIVLVDILTDNPIHCFNCKNEIDPEILKLDSKLVDDIASWYGVFQSLYNLWLNSGEYEAYAKDKLINKNSQVNVEGMSVAKRLSAYYPSYYWWFSDTDDGELTHCPNCAKKLDPNVKFGRVNASPVMSSFNTHNKSCQSDSLFRGFFVPVATLAQNTTPQTAAALSVIKCRKLQF